ncbi:MAG: hypothetical protein Q9225_001567, partial [Loekoesia sp. 1 TL-2023]
MPRVQEEEDYSPPGETENLDRLAAPSPVETNQQPCRRATLEQTDVDLGHRQHVEYGSEQEEYDPPYEYENLDKLKAPSPVESPQLGRKSGYLEDQGSSTSRSTQSNPSSRPTQGTGRAFQKDGEPAPEPAASASSSPSDLSPAEIALAVRHQRDSHFATELYTISYLIFFSILGVLARLGLQALTFYPGAPVQTSVLWPNVGGSLLIGFLIEDRKLFTENWATGQSSSTITSIPLQNLDNDDHHQQQQFTNEQSKKHHHASLKKTIPLYTGLTTGFCGSFTSFSSFIRDAFLALANALPTPISHTSSSTPTSTIPRNAGYSFMALLAIIIVTVSLCLSALILGTHLATATDKYTPPISSHFTRRFLDRAMVFLGWTSWLGAIVLAIWPPDRRDQEDHWRGDALFALVFAPLGCLA